MLTPAELELKGLMSLPTRTPAQQKRMAQLMFALPSLSQKENVQMGVADTQPIGRQGVATETPLRSDALLERTNVTDPYAKYLQGSDFQSKSLMPLVADTKSYKGQALGNIASTGLAGILGLGQMIAGRKMRKNLGEPKYPEQLPNQQLASALAQAQADAQMADPLIREQALTDIAEQKRLNDEIARVTSSGDISAYAGMAQANQGRVFKSLRDLALAQAQSKAQRQGMRDQLIGMKMGEGNKLFGNKLRKFENVDLPEFQARRDYASNLTNKGLENILVAASQAGQYGKIFPQAKSMGMGLTETFNKLPYEQQVEMAKKYPQFKALVKKPKTPKVGGVAEIIKTPKKTEELVEYTMPTATAFNWGI